MDVFNLDDMKFSPTAALFEGLPRAGVGISVFVVRTPPGKGVDIHVHPYSETFVLLEGSGRWTAGGDHEVRWARVSLNARTSSAHNGHISTCAAIDCRSAGSHSSYR